MSVANRIATLCVSIDAVRYAHHILTAPLQFKTQSSPVRMSLYITKSPASQNGRCSVAAVFVFEAMANPGEAITDNG